MKNESFEESLGKLEEIIRHLEKGDLSLDDSLKAFEEGIKWSRACEQKLTEAKGKIEMLVKAEGGTLKEAPFKVEE
jgi:exodeoxyribonuclease VII small subunit